MFLLLILDRFRPAQALVFSLAKKRRQPHEEGRGSRSLSPIIPPSLLNSLCQNIPLWSNQTPEGVYQRLDVILSNSEESRPFAIAHRDGINNLSSGTQLSTVGRHESRIAIKANLRNSVSQRPWKLNPGRLRRVQKEPTNS